MPKHGQPVSFKKGWITKEELKERAKLFPTNYLGNYLLKLHDQN